MSLCEAFSEDILNLSDVEGTVAEIHILSYFYHWPYSDCWDIPCLKRGVFTDKIKAQLKAEEKAAKKANKNQSSGKTSSRRPRIRKPRKHH